MSEFDTIITTCGGSGVPTKLADELKAENDTEFEQQDKAQYQDVQNDIGLPEEIYDRLKGRRLDPFDLQSIFNEMFHAFYDQFIEQEDECAWIMTLMRAEARASYNNNLEMVEEAMSETIDSIVGALVVGSTLGRAPSISYENNASTPRHDEEGQKWDGKAEAKTKISRRIFVLALYILYFGCDRPAGETAEDQEKAMREALAEADVPIGGSSGSDDDSNDSGGGE